jgi:acetyl-CoA synthetase
MPHGLVAMEENTTFYTIVLKPQIEAAAAGKKVVATSGSTAKTESVDETYLWQNFIDVETNENGTPTKITFKNEEKFNFAFDIGDEMAKIKPEKLAMVYVANDGVTDKFITYKQVSRASSQCANYFKSLGIKKGDRVMLVLKRHYQYWYAMLGLNKLGAIAIPAPNQLVEHDFEYRFNAAGITAILCTADGETADYSVDGGWWQVFIGEESATIGADGIAITDGGVYKLVYTIG